MKPENHLVNDERFKKGNFWSGFLPQTVYNLDSHLAENNSAWKAPFYFVQAADTQFGLMRRWQYIEPGFAAGKKGWLDGEIKEWEQEKKLSREVVSLVNALEPKPKFMIICGDMLDQFPYKVDERHVDGTMTAELDPVRTLEQAKQFQILQITRFRSSSDRPSMMILLKSSARSMCLCFVCAVRFDC